MTTPRPTCVHCGKPYGSRWTETQKVTWPVGEDQPKYNGNAVLVKETSWGTTPSRESVEREEASKAPFARMRPERIAQYPDVAMHSMYRETWDGESYVKPYEPFCKLRCALDYARKAYKKWGTT